MAKRQKNGTGSIFELKNGLVMYRVSLGVGMDGKLMRKSFYGKNEKEAIAKYKEWLKEIGNTPIEKVTTVGEWADKWLDLYKKNGQKKVAYSTYRNYKIYVDNYIKPLIGGLKFEQVRPAHIEQFFQKLPLKMSESARRHINITLNGIFKTAVENRFCQSNPVKPMPMPETNASIIKVFTAEQLKKIIKDAQRNPLGIYVLFPLYTGMRLGELLALMWSDVDCKEGKIVIRSAMVRSEDGQKVGRPKSGKERIVGIPEKFKKTILKMPRTSLYVFPNKSGAPLSQHQYELRYRKFFDETGNEYLSPHKCRHTYATYLIKGGADLRGVQELLGHSKVTVTEIYTHVDISDIKNNVSKLKY